MSLPSCFFYLRQRRAGASLSACLLSAGIFLLIFLLSERVVQAQTISFRVSERTLDQGDTLVLKWNIQNVRRRDSIFVTGVQGEVPPKGELKLCPEEDTKYTLVHVRRKKVTTRNIKVKVNKPEIVLFQGPDSVFFRTACMLQWKTRFATQIEIEQEAQHLPAYGAMMFTPSSPVTYTLKACNNNNRCATALHRVEMPGDYVKGPSVLRVGEAGYLEWRFKDAIKVKLDGRDSLLPKEGSIRITPQETREYTFSVLKNGIQQKDTTLQYSLKVPVVKANYISGVKNYFSLTSGKKLIFDIFSVDWRDFPAEIKLKVMITDTSGNYITGLAPPYITEEQSRRFFRMIIETVEGKSYPINDFTVKEIRSMTSTPHDIALVLDYSGSMSGSFKQLDEATREFLKKKHQADRLGIVRFDDSIGVESPLTRNVSELELKIPFNKGRDYGGSTALYAAADAGMRLLNDSMRDRQLVLMTDGYENSSMYYWGHYFTFATEVMLRARRDLVTINTINFKGQANTPLLEAFADMSGGRSYQVDHEDDIQKVFFELQHLYNHYYEVVYKPATDQGNRQIDLVYNDGTNESATTSAVAYVSDSLDINSIERKGLGQSTQAPYYKNKLIVQRQTVALFDFDRSRLDESARYKLDQVAQYLKTNPAYTIVVLGHSDLIGDEAHCRKISNERADEVYQYLRKAGVSPSRISREGKGKSDPVWFVEDIEWKARENRRVEILFLQ